METEVTFLSKQEGQTWPGGLAPGYLKAWTMTVPKRMKRAEKMRDSRGIISRLEAKAAVSPQPRDLAFSHEPTTARIWLSADSGEKGPKPHFSHTKKQEHKTGCFEGEEVGGGFRLCLIHSVREDTGSNSRTDTEGLVATDSRE